MGGMIAIAFTATCPERVVAACADVAFAKPDLYRRTLFRVWRRMAETMPWDEFSDHVTTQAVGAAFMESAEGEDIFAMVRDDRRPERSLHRPPGVPGDGGHGPLGRWCRRSRGRC